MKVSKKYHKITLRSSQNQAAEIVQSILGNTDLHIFSKNAMVSYQGHMAKQIVTAERQSIQQIRSNVPYQPYSSCEDPRPDKNIHDTIRPYSAKIQRLRKINTANPSSSPPFLSSRKVSIMRSSKSFKSFKSINKQQKNQSKSQLSKYKSRLIPLLSQMQENQECDKVIEQLRKNKFKLQQYERGKQNFLNSITKENQDYAKRQMKFASTMSRKQYTYTYTGQIVQIANEKQQKMKKKSNTYKNTMIITSKKIDEAAEKPQNICVQYARKEPRAELKDFIFGSGPEVVKKQIFCPTNSCSTKYTLVAQDC